ncbi:trypsin-like peptidase domain-containing protein [Candidatus Dependentiae bacterium]|nr:trypsin-like peptidase domain-containing protein [Candidatus Dependentiae bacterium]
MRIVYSIIGALVAGILIAVGIVNYRVYRELQTAQTKSQTTQVSTEKPVLIPDNSMISDDELKISKRQMWSDLQRKLKDTVVQVFAQIAEFNWLEPYKTPNQYEATGTAFFINDQGELITNAHVVDQAKVLFIQIPSLGKRRFEVEVVGVSPERDLALLKLKEHDNQELKKDLNRTSIPYLKLGNSDTIYRADKLMALGFPLGQQGLKSTTGVVSGREHIEGQHFIQISAALNKGNSGGPSLNSIGEVIGVNSAIIQNAQNVGYIIPINEVRLFLDQVRSMPATTSVKLLRKPYLGLLYKNGSEMLTKFLGNPLPGGLYIVEVYKSSPLAKAGIQGGDMIYKINGNTVDIYGEMNVPWSAEDKVSIVDYISRLKVGQDITLDYYRKGVAKSTTFKFSQSEVPPVHIMYPGYEKVDYEVIGGLVVMPLTINHIVLIGKYVPDLLEYSDIRKNREPRLIVTHILLNSPASRSRTIGAGAVIAQVNGQKVTTLDELRKVVPQSLKTGYLTLRTVESVLVVMPFDEVMRDERQLSATYFYPLSSLYKNLAQVYQSDKAVGQAPKAPIEVQQTK